MKLKITHIVVHSASIREFVLADVDGAALAVAGGGAHILIHIPGPERIWKNAYSLISPRDSHREYRIIVRRVEHSRGGSVWLHDNAAIGDVLFAETPQNLFPIPLRVHKHLLLSAGIGITPMLAYLQVLRKPFELHHCCKLEDAPTFSRLLAGTPAAVLHTSRNTLDLERLLARQGLGTHLSVCGPEAFMDAAVQGPPLRWLPTGSHQSSQKLKDSTYANAPQKAPLQ